MVNKSELAMTVKNNIETLCKKEHVAKKQLATLCNVRPSSISKWCSDSPILPSVEYLYIMAEHFGVTVDWLLSDHSAEKMTERLLKYNQAFIALTPLIDNKTLDPKDLKDPVLQYLEQRYQELCNSDVSEEERNAWMQKIIKEYDVELPQHIENLTPQPNDEAYLHLAKAMRGTNSHE